MVKDWGLSPRLGPIGYGSDGPAYLSGPQFGQERPYAEGTQDRDPVTGPSALLRAKRNFAIPRMQIYRTEHSRYGQGKGEGSADGGPAVRRDQVDSC